MTSHCPKCHTPSNHVIMTFDRTFPPPAVHVRRFRCIKPGCGSAPTNGKLRTFWDVAEPIKQLKETPS